MYTLGYKGGLKSTLPIVTNIEYNDLTYLVQNRLDSNSVRDCVTVPNELLYVLVIFVYLYLYTVYTYVLAIKAFEKCK